MNEMLRAESWRVMERNAKRVRRTSAAVDVLFACVCGLLGALALMHWIVGAA